MIVGITGPIASGKSVLTQMFIDKGFIKISLSEEVREECRGRGLSIERISLQNIGNELRKLNGAGYWAKRLIGGLDLKKDYVVEGIRNPGEIKEFRKLRNFVLLGVDAPVENRLKWIKRRNKDSDPKTMEAIQEMEERDRGKGEEAEGQQVSACFALSDEYIQNDSTLENLKEKAASLVEQLIG